MSQLVIEDIKAIVRKTVRAMGVPDVFGGTVVSVDPLQVEASVNRKPYPASALYVPDHIERLREGDDVILVRALGGQKFLVAGTVGRAKEEEEPDDDPRACPYGNDCKWCARLNTRLDEEDPFGEPDDDPSGKTGPDEPDPDGGGGSGGEDYGGEDW